MTFKGTKVTNKVFEDITTGLIVKEDLSAMNIIIPL